MALHWVNRHTCWMGDLLKEMNVELGQPTMTMAANQAATLLSNEDIVTIANPYIRTPYHCNKECVAEKLVGVKCISTKDNLADIFTKSVPRQVLERLLPHVTGYWQ